MRIYKEESLTNFEFWGIAKGTADKLTSDELIEIEYILEDLYPDGIDETTLNDIFAYDVDFIAEMIGLADSDELYNREEE